MDFTAVHVHFHDLQPFCNSLKMSNHNHAGGGGGEAGGLDPIRKSHVIWVDLDLLPPLTKFPGSAHGGQFISLQCIRTDCLMEEQARG